MPYPIKLLIADDHNLFRHGLVSLFKTRQDFMVVGEAVDGLDAVGKARRLRPDLILLDVRMPEQDGIETLRRIRRDQPGARIVMLTGADDDTIILEALRAGAQGYILKTTSPDALFRHLYAVMSGGTALDAKISPALKGRAVN